MSARPSTWQTSYHALAVDSGESEEEEEEIVDTPPAVESTNTIESAAKLTKTAQRKAAKAARLEKQQTKTKAKATGPASGASTPAKTSREPSTVEPQAMLDDMPALEPMGNGFEQSTGPASIGRVDASKPSAPLTNGHHTPASAPTSAPASAPLLSTEAAAAPSKVLPEVPLQKTVAPIVAPVTQAVQDVASAAAKVVEPVKVAVAQGAGKASEALRQVQNQVQAQAPGSASRPPVSGPEEAAKAKKRADVLERTVWTFIMIGGFIGLLLMGHSYMICLVLFCQTLVYREVTALFSLKNAESKTDTLSLDHNNKQQGRDPWSKTLNWYFFATTNYFLYGESIIYYFKHIVFVDANLTMLANQHRFISFVLYTIGFVGFVASLKRRYLKQQFGLFCWVHMTLLLIVISSHFIVNNILEGLIWFWVPASLVICNDIFAYICGVTMGRTPLIALSPKKTVEGFVGALFCTIIFGIAWGTYFMSFDYMVCPVQDLGVSAFSSVSCVRNPVFVWQRAEIPEGMAKVLSTVAGRSITTMPYVPYQLHLFFLSCFASLVAPFGGFFASGFKRAFNIKDFGDSIPGHGGMTDRMDCQFLMGVFTYVYYTSLIRTSNVTVGSVLQTIVSSLTTEEQLQLIGDLKKYIEGQGIAVSL